MSETNIEETKQNTESAEVPVQEEAQIAEDKKEPTETEATTETTEVKAEAVAITDKNPLENE